MASNERGLQNKSDDKTRQYWESGDFPMVCETCLGENPYLRMQRLEHAGTCKMCDRPYTVFKWRPGRGEGYRQTQVCQTCSKIKNLCQTCILDLQFGLPSQLRDAVLSQDDGTLAVPESDANREYFAAQHMALVASGSDPWQSGETPNEKLLKIARNAAVDREQNQNKLATLAGKKRDASDFNYATSSGATAEITTQPQIKDTENDHSNVILPPPGMSIESMEALSSSRNEKISTDSVIQSALKSLQSTTDTQQHLSKKPKPPKPAGPPPPWAFRKKDATSIH